MPVVLPPSVAHTWRQRVLVLPGAQRWRDCLVCGREIHHPAKAFCRPCWRPLYRQLAARLHRHVSAADVAAMLLAAYFDGSHDRERAAA